MNKVINLEVHEKYEIFSIYNLQETSENNNIKISGANCKNSINIELKESSMVKLKSSLDFCSCEDQCYHNQTES